jgi:hypothetical protein
MTTRVSRTVAADANVNVETVASTINVSFDVDVRVARSR